MLEQYYLSANYKGKFKCETKVTDNDVDKYYNDHKNDYKKWILYKKIILQSQNAQ